MTETPQRGIDNQGATETRTCSFTVDGIVRARFLDGAEVELDDAIENIARTAVLTKGQRLPVMVDLRGVRSQSGDARAYFAGPEANGVSSAVALIIGSPLSRMIGNFFLGFNRPTVPTRLFTHPADAERWLLEQPRTR